MNGPHDALHLHDPGLRVGLIAEVRDQLAPSAGLHQLDADALVRLWNYSEGHLSHGEHYRLEIATYYQPPRVL